VKEYDASERLLCFKDYTLRFRQYPEVLHCFTPHFTIDSERKPYLHYFSNSILLLEFKSTRGRRENLTMCKKAACDSCSMSIFSFAEVFASAVYRSRFFNDSLLTLPQARPPGGVAANTSRVSCPTFPRSNGAHADRGLNKKATSTLRWGR
jgi:hypothetical protein